MMSNQQASQDSQQSRIPGDPGVWIIIYGELAIFGFFFLLFAYHRASNLMLYSAGQHMLERGYGIVNTVLLLTSSCLVAIAVRELRTPEKRGAAPSLLFCAILCGTGFCINKLFEYYHEISEGNTLNTNEFFTFYYMLTGLHLTHVIIGIFLILTALRISTKPQVTSNQILLCETFGLFWHLVDMLWVFLFALFYVMI